MVKSIALIPVELYVGIECGSYAYPIDDIFLVLSPRRTNTFVHIPWLHRVI